MGWHRYFVVKGDDGWSVVHYGNQCGMFRDKNAAANFAVERARIDASRSSGNEVRVVLVQGEDGTFREL
ncbi:MAG: DUF2188 domain-containing protein [Alphaproteobacteria bacterium]